MDGAGQRSAAGTGAAPAAAASTRAWWTVPVAVSGAVIALLILFVPPPAGSPPGAMTTLALTTLTMVLWATGAVPHHWAAAAFLAVALALRLAPPEIVLKGFASSAVGLVMGGLIVGSAAHRSGLGRLIARGFLRGFYGSYARLILGILAGSVALSFLVPAAMARMAITVPIVCAIAHEAGYGEGSPGYLGTVLTAVIANFLISHAILPANLSQVLVLGTAETLYGVRLTYGEYLLMCGPVIGVLKALVVYAAILWLFPAPPPERVADSGEPLRLTRDGRWLAVLLAGAVLMWTTDVWHHIAPGWVALAAGALCVLPGVGLVPLKEAVDATKLKQVLILAGVLGIGAVVNHSGAGRIISQEVVRIAAIEGRSALYGYFAVVGIMSAVALIAAVVGAIAIVTPTVAEVSRVTGLPLKTGIYAEVMGVQTLFFPYQTVPTMFGLTLGRVPFGEAAKLMIVVALVSLVALVPLNGLWWRWLGAIP